MSVKETINRHNLIVQRLRKSPASLPEILSFIEQRTEEENLTLKPSRRTFYRDRAEILELYTIDIQFSRTDNCYYLAKGNDPNLGDRILEAYNLGQMLRLPEAVSGQILLEKRRSKGTEHIDTLLDAIREHLVVSYTYQNYADPAITARTVYPYALKEFRGRWYLLATEVKDTTIKSFGLDRMSGLKITNRSFKVPESFNPEQKYRDCFGIMGPNAEAPSSIHLSFEPVAGRYIKSFPLHHSQQVVVDNEEEVQITLRLYITRDFIMELLSYGASVRIMAPTTLRTTMREEHLQSLQSLEA